MTSPETSANAAPPSHAESLAPPSGGDGTPARRSYRAILGVLVGLGVLLGIGIVPKIHRRAELASAHAASRLPRRVVFAEAQLGAASSQLVLPGAALPIETAVIYARTNGFVREFKVDIGDTVKAGQVLAVLDAPEMEAEAQSARARADEGSRNELIARSTADRFENLARAGVNSQQQADEARARANSAEAALRTSRADVTRWNSMLEFRMVRAPFDGVVTKRNVEKGVLVTAGSSTGVTSLYEVARTETLKVFVEVPQSLAQDIRVGGAARVTSGTLEVPGTIARTSGALDPTTRTLRTEVHVPGDRGILAGSFVRVGLDTNTATPPVRVPANSLVARSGGNFVLVVGDGNRIEERAVVLGRELGAEAEIASGLAPGARVVTNPPENLNAGEIVEPVARPATPPAAGEKSRASK